MIKPHRAPQYEVSQSRFDHVPELPTRMLVVAPSGAGKTVLLVSLVLDVYPKAFARIYIFSPSVHIDRQWDAVKDFQARKMGVDGNKEKLYFDEFQPGDLQNIIDQQARITHLSKTKGMSKLHQVLVILDDIADDPRITRQAKPVHELFVRGRHHCISTIASVQKYRVLAPLIRVNATDLIVFRLRSMHELNAILEENSAVYGEKALEEMYTLATHEPYSFLYIKLAARRPEDMFYLRFDSHLIPRGDPATQLKDKGRRK
jgi:hypothetical protein